MKLRELLKEQFGIENAAVKKMEGESWRSIIYRVDTAEGKKFVFKQYRTESGLYELLQAENQILQKLSSQFPNSYPSPVSNLEGNFLSFIENGKQLSRLLTFKEGRFLAEVEHSTQLFRSIGRFLAQMDKTLLDFRHPAIEARQLNFDLNHCLNNRKYLVYVDKPEQRKLVDYFFSQFSELVLPEIPSLRKCVIHSDANDWNLLVRDDEISGIIDFGDMVYSSLVNELAIAITYSIFGKSAPIPWACQVIKGYNEILPLRKKEIELLYYLIAARLCISVCNSAYRKTRNPENKYITISEKPAWELLERWITINPLQATNAFAKSTGLDAKLPVGVEADLERRWKYLSKSLVVSYLQPIKMVKAAFQYMYGADGRTYLDARNNIPHVGHCHPKVVQAGQQQMASLNTNTHYLYDQVNEYAEHLLAKFPNPLNKVFFVNSGSAASDLAIRLAYTHTGHRNIMVVEHGYHGNTKMGIDISPYKFDGEGGEGQPPFILKAPIPDAYRGPYKHNSTKTGRLYAAEAINLLSERAPVAAFVCEPVIGGGGQVPLPKGYLPEVYRATRAAGGLCVSDEVQTGFGRVGEHFWGFQLHDVVPDIVVLGKPMGNGHPLAAVVTTDEVVRSFENGMEFFSSYGGNPVSCAVGLAVLEVIEEEELQKNALTTGSYLKQQLRALMSSYPEIGDVRGHGFFLGVELVKDTTTQEPHHKLATQIENQLRTHGILVGTEGPYENVLKIKPPMCFTKGNAQQLTQELEAALNTSPRHR